MSALFLVITSLLAVPLAGQNTLAALRPIGFVYGEPVETPRVRIEFYIDLLCPDTARAWPVMLDVANRYRDQGVEMTAHLFPLPFHTNSFYASRATYVIHALTRGEKTFDWMQRILLEEIPNLKDSVFHDKSDDDLLRHFESIVSELEVDPANFTAHADRRNREQFELMTRVSWKHAAAKGVWATPIWFVNDVYQPTIGYTWSGDDWDDFLQPYLADFFLDGIDNAEEVSSD